MEGMSLRRARAELSKLVDVPVTAVGRFTVFDPNTFRAVAGFMAGAAALGGMSSVTGQAVEMTLDLLCGPVRPSPQLPHHVLVVVTEDAVTAFGTQRSDLIGDRVARWDAGMFGAHIARLPFEIDLTLDAPPAERVVLGGKRGRRSGVAATSRAAYALADPDKCW